MAKGRVNIMIDLKRYPDGGRNKMAYSYINKNGVLMYIFTGSCIFKEIFELDRFYFCKFDAFPDVPPSQASNAEEAEQLADAVEP